MTTDTPKTTRDDLADRLLAVRCRLGESAAFDELVERWHVPLWRYVRRLSPDDATAEELLQDVWLRIVKGIATLREPERFVAWMFRIARYACLDRMRGRYGAADVEAEGADLDLDRFESTADPDAFDPDADALHRGLMDLPLVEREVLVLFYLEELDLRQVAEVLEVPEGTVKSRLFRARKLLRERLEDQGWTR